MKIAKFNTFADAERAVRRARRWLVSANINYMDPDKPPAHIAFNTRLAEAQFGAAAFAHI